MFHGFDPSKPLILPLSLSTTVSQSWVLAFLPAKSLALVATPPSITTAMRAPRPRRGLSQRRSRRIRSISVRAKRTGRICISWSPKTSQSRGGKAGRSPVGSARISGMPRISTNATRLESCWDTDSSGTPTLPQTRRMGIESRWRELKRTRYIYNLGYWDSSMFFINFGSCTFIGFGFPLRCCLAKGRGRNCYRKLEAFFWSGAQSLVVDGKWWVSAQYFLFLLPWIAGFLHLVLRWPVFGWFLFLFVNSLFWCLGYRSSHLWS